MLPAELGTARDLLVPTPEDVTLVHMAPLPAQSDGHTGIATSQRHAGVVLTKARPTSDAVAGGVGARVAVHHRGAGGVVSAREADLLLATAREPTVVPAAEGRVLAIVTSVAVLRAVTRAAVAVVLAQPPGAPGRPFAGALAGAVLHLTGVRRAPADVATGAWGAAALLAAAVVRAT